jgi:hypothetical protein
MADSHLIMLSVKFQGATLNFRACTSLTAKPGNDISDTAATKSECSMDTQVKRIMQKLTQAQYRKHFVEECERAYSLAVSFCNGEVGEDWEWLEDDWSASCEEALQIHDPEKILGRIDSDVGTPAVLRPGELWNEFKIYFESKSLSGNFDDIYEYFVHHVEHRLLTTRSSEPFVVCNVLFPAASETMSPEAKAFKRLLISQLAASAQASEEAVRSAENEVASDEGAAEATPPNLGKIGEFDVVLDEVRFECTERSLRTPDKATFESGELYVKLSARCSERAMADLRTEVKVLARSHFKSISLLDTPVPTHSTFARQRASIGIDNLKKYLHFGLHGLESAVVNNTSKNDFQVRIANAVRVLAEADNQRSDPLGLALCVVAIDALLGQPGTEGTTKLADFVASLLEPDVSERRRAADYVIKLYSKRSDALHGRKVEGDALLRSNARMLAASLLYAVWSHRDFFRRYADKDVDVATFLRELRSSFVQPGLPAGVIELPVRNLWKSNA